MSVRVLRVMAMVAVVVAGWSASAQANAPAGRYTIGGGNVLDNKTKLTWQQALFPAATLANAKASCLAVGMHLPTIKEVQTIIDYTQTSNPMIDTVAFPGTPNAFVWTSTASSNPAFVSTVNFFYLGSGFSNIGIATAATDALVFRCVR